MINLKEKYDGGIHYFYRIDNLINGKFYYGIRTCHCLPGKDTYMGSGVHLHNAFRFYGIENFKKTVLRVLPTRQDAKDLERWIVDDKMVKNPMCYNYALGGGETTVFDGVTIVNEDGTYSIISKTEYRKGGYKSTISGKMPVFDKELNKNSWVPIEDYYSNKDRYIPNSKLYRTTSLKGKVIVKDKCGNTSSVSVTDPRYKSGELVHIWKGRKHSESSKLKMSKANRRTIGENNPMYGKRRIWINNGSVRKYVLPNELDSYLNDSECPWRLGSSLTGRKPRKSRKKTETGTTKGFIQMTNGLENTMIHPSKVPEYEAKGYWKGITQFKKHQHNPNSGNKGKRWIHKSDGSRKLINGTDLNSFLNNGEGWIEGYK